MKSFLDKTEGLANTVSLFAANIAAVILLILVVLTCVDVVGRYLFTMPLIGAVELVRICMAGIIFFSFPIMFLKGDHIIVDLISFLKKGYFGWVLALIILAVSIGVAVMLGDRVYDYAIRALEDGDTTEYLAIPRYIVVGFITLSIFSAAFMSLLRLVLMLRKPGVVEDEGEGAL
ncbi:MAG: TRAP transporter small permease [Leucothrix sp.]